VASNEQVAGSGEYRHSDIVGTGLFRGKPVTYAVIDGQAVFEGDIVLGTPEELRTGVHPRPLGVAISGDQYRWPKAIIPYTIDPAMPDQDQVTDAIAHWQANTTMRFVLRTTTNASVFPKYVTFRSGNGCSADGVGRRGGQQVVTLGTECLKGQAIHEIGHVVGLWHEQSRRDRDSYVTINYANILTVYASQFDQHLSDGSEITEYDYGSIMHYSSTAFSKPPGNLDTIVPRGGQSIGQRVALSENDIKAVHNLYPTWVQLPSRRAAYIAIGADGSIWITVNDMNTTTNLSKWNGTAWVAQSLPSTGTYRVAVAPDGSPWVECVAQGPTHGERIYHLVGGTWVQLPSYARDIAVGTDGSVWIIETTEDDLHYVGISKLSADGTKWEQTTPLINRDPHRIAVAPDGAPWVADFPGFHGAGIHRLNGTAWEQVPGGPAADISIGADGSVWIIDGWNIAASYWTGFEWVTFDYPPGTSARSIAVDHNGLPWAAGWDHGSDGHVFRWYVPPHPSWSALPGSGTDIAVGKDGTAWKVGGMPVGLGFKVSEWDGTDWVDAADLTAGAAAVAVAADGSPWVVAGDQTIHHLISGAWTLVPGTATDIAIGADGSIWIVGTSSVAHGYNVASWSSATNSWVDAPDVTNGAKAIAVASDGTPWVVTSNFQILTLVNGVWQTITGAAHHLGAGADGSIWMVGTSSVANGYNLAKWNGTGWDAVDGAGYWIAVGPEGTPWVVDNNADILKQNI
jgi:hypothetical protein